MTRARRGAVSRRGFLAGLVAAGVAVAGWRVVSALAPGGRALRGDLAEDVRYEFLRSYQAYLRLAGDHDELQPLSGTGNDFFADGHPVALAVIESLDTLYLMELDDELAEAVEAASRVDFDIDAPFQVFEAIIRLVGGLLSGYHATGDDRLLEKARDLADRLLPAFERSPTGMPYRFANLRTGEVSEPNNVLAEIGTNVAELGDLSRLTGDDSYFDAARRAQQAVFDRRSEIGLVGTAIDVETGEWTDGAATLNPPVDSFFEYLYDGAAFLDDAEMRTRYDTLTEAILAQQQVEIDGNLWFATVDHESGARISVVQSELTAFYAGLLAESGHIELGRRYHDSWKAVLDHGYRILPEGVDPAGFRATSASNQLRPEYVDAAFHLWLKSGDDVYVDRAAEYYENMKATSRVENGYTILQNVQTRPELLGDLTPGYWYSENMKYYWLMFGQAARFDYGDHYLTTEGNVLRGLRRR
jgi:hypothetical protein